MERIVVLGTGTGVGKTYVGAALARALREAGSSVQALKPIETGFEPQPSGEPLAGTDAFTLERAASILGRPTRPHPLYAFREPISPHLAARRCGRIISVPEIRDWANSALRDNASLATIQILETAGGVFSPLSAEATNADLAAALGPARLLLVAPDRLGVLHDLRATLTALTTRAQTPDWLVLSTPDMPDASTGTNAGEIEALGMPAPVAICPRGAPPDLRELVRRIRSAFEKGPAS
jgi:dethiobiotin synthetase